MQNQSTFPYEGWVLMPSCKPVKLVFDELYYSQWHRPAKGKAYHTDNIHSSKEEAIAAGHLLIKKQQEALDKQQANINKRVAALNKAAAKP